MSTKQRPGYQPIWKDGREHGVGWRDCNGRYEAIQRYLVGRMGSDARQLGDPLRVFEVGAYNGYFCRRLADDFRASCVAIDGQPFLEDYDSPSGGEVFAVHKLVTPADITDQGDNWHPDIVMCMSVLHHWPNWKDYAQALIGAGRVVFIETANPDENLASDAKEIARQADDYFRTKLAATILVETPPMNGQTALRPLWVIDNG